MFDNSKEFHTPNVVKQWLESLPRCRVNGVHTSLPVSRNPYHGAKRWW